MRERETKQFSVWRNQLFKAVTYLERLMIKVLINFGILAGFQFLKKKTFFFVSQNTVFYIILFSLENPPVIVYALYIIQLYIIHCIYLIYNHLYTGDEAK